MLYFPFRQCLKLAQATVVSVPSTWTMWWEIWVDTSTWSLDRLYMWSIQSTRLSDLLLRQTSILTQDLRSGSQLILRSLDYRHQHYRYCILQIYYASSLGSARLKNLTLWQSKKVEAFVSYGHISSLLTNICYIVLINFNNFCIYIFIYNYYNRYELYI